MSQSVSNLKVYVIRLGGYARVVKTYHFPLGGTIMGEAVLFVVVVVVVVVVVLVVDMTGWIGFKGMSTGRSKMTEIDHVKSRYYTCMIREYHYYFTVR